MMNLPNIVTKDLKDMPDLFQAITQWRKLSPWYVAFDSEADGLDIKHNKPFLITFGYITNDFSTIYTYAIDLELRPYDFVEAVHIFLLTMCKRALKVFGHNILFDLHMLDNADLDKPGFENLSNTQFYIRLAHDALNAEQGGPPLDLKGYAARYVNPLARQFQNNLTMEIREKKANATRELVFALRDYPLIPSFQITGTEKRWTKAMVETFLKDKMNEVDDFPEEFVPLIRQFFQKQQEAENYRLLNRANVTFYAHYDIVYTLCVFLVTKDSIVERKQEATLKREEDALEFFYLMECTGQYFDLDYAQTTRVTLKRYIRQLRQDLIDLMGIPVKVGQHALIKQLFLEDFKIILESVDKKNLNGVILHELTSDKAKRIAEIVIELRSLEKWYSTYLMKYINLVERYGSNIIYPTWNASGTVTGRASSPFQQFPKEPKLDIDGNHLFHPRKMFLAPPGKAMYFFDFNAMELRLQAIYTMLVGKGDINLCRAYIPFQCTQREGKWYLDEAPTVEWHKTDLHALTAINAFHIDKTHPNFGHYRSIGKRGNFAMIYGATPERLAESLRITLAEATKLYNSFYSTYKGIMEYIMYVKRFLATNPFIENLFGRRYYNINAHLGRNYLIQGTGADYTKALMPEIVKLIKGTGIQINGYVHDEFSFVIPEEDRSFVPLIQKTMEQLETEIKLLVEVKCATTDWADEHDYRADEKHGA